jgi:hypothetical protein
MKNHLKLGFVGLILGMVSSVFATDLQQGSLLMGQEQRVDIIIRNSEFLISERVGLQFGLPTVIVLRNQDIIRHGFTSPILGGLSVQGEGEGIMAYGKGMEGFYVDMGKTLVLRFTADRKGRYEFRCDLHPQMRGEVFLLEMSTA